MFDRGGAYVDPWVNLALTTGFAFCAALLLWIFVTSGDYQAMGTFAVLFALMGVFIRVTKKIGFHAGRWVSTTFLTGAPFNDPMSKYTIATKFEEQSWQLAIHVTMVAFEMYVLAGEPWFDDPSTCWVPHPREQEVKFSLKLFYLTQLAVWVFTCFSHRFLEIRRKDYVEMYVHHVATILLVAGSYHGSNLRIGIVILLIHDFSDIFIDSMKMINYLKLEDKAGYFLSEIAFTINCLVWVYFRLYVFPFRVLKSAFYEGQLASFWAPSCVLLSVLQVLHVFWFYLMLRIAYKVIYGSIHEAGAEYYEGTSGEDNGVASNKDN